MVFLIASQQSQIDAWIAVVVVGLLIGVIGHLWNIKLLIVTGIAIVGGFSAYFAFGVAHLS
jgi:hypothetical protein